MRRNQFYFRKKITKTVLNNLQTYVEDAVDRIFGYRNIQGITSGINYTATPGTGFRISFNSGGGGPLRGFAGDGSFISLGINPYETDDLSPQFSLPSAGNEKWLTVYSQFARDPQQPETDPSDFSTVYFDQQESFSIVVSEGVQAPAGTATKLALSTLTDCFYLCDVLVTSASTDFSVNPPVKDTARMAIDPMAEVAERVSLSGDRFGSEAKLALIGGTDPIRFRDIQGSDTDLEDAILAALAAGASGADRLALLSEAIGAGYSETRYVNSYQFLGPGTALPINATIPANCRLIKARIIDSSNISTLFIYFTIDVLTGRIDYRYTQHVGAGGVYGSGHAQNVLIAGVIFLGTTSFDAGQVNLTSYGGAGGSLIVQTVVGGANVHHGSADVEFII